MLTSTRHSRCLLGLCLLLLAPSARAAEPGPWDAGGLPDFRFTDRSGREIGLAELKGRPWVAGFIFTRCAGPCPKVTAAMNEIRRATGVRMVTITVDPAFDTPEVLAQYANNFTATDPGQEDEWYFLTGDRPAIYALIQQGFKMPVAEMPGAKEGEQFLHTTNLLYVDAEGRVRGKYNAAIEAEVADLKRFIQLPPFVALLPKVNASLNALAGCLLAVGYILIKLKRRKAHEYTMYAAFLTSVVFLACYLVYHSYHLTKSFAGEGTLKIVYLVILATHVVLAACVPFLAIATIRLGRRQDWPRHVRLAKITFPIWMYVSITGVVIYWMLYEYRP